MLISEAKLTKWGNGRGILLPKEVCDMMGVSVGDKLSLHFDETNKVLHVENEETFSMQVLLRGYEGPKPGEIDAPSESAGRELW